jgi:large subunit ribosomal protein L24
MKIKKGDTVIMKSGKDHGKRGKVLRAIPQEDKLLVEGVNVVKRSEKARKQGQKGQVMQKPMPVRASSAMYVCTRCDKGVRLGAKIIGDKKVRVCKSCGTEI